LIGYWPALPLSFLGDRRRAQLFHALLFMLIGLTAFMVARPFVMFYDQVRITSQKTPFSYWGDFLGHTWTVPVQPMTNRDFFNSLFLAFGGFISIFMYILRRGGFPSAGPLALPRRLWGLMAFGFLWASVDELAMIHEFLGPNLPGLRSVTITKYPDDVIMLSYVGVCALVFFRYLKHFLHRKGAFTVLLLAGLFQILSAINGLPQFNLNEESFELFGGLCYFAAIFWYAYREIEETLDHQQS
jgi:hypothetical protein